MKVVTHLLLCVDCAMIAVNDDASGMDDETERKCREGIAELGGHLCYDGGEDSHVEFSWSSCDCCDSRLGGSRERFVILSEGTEAA